MSPHPNLLRTLLIACLLAGVGACSSLDRDALRSAVGDGPVVMLSTESCGYCRRLRHDLHQWGVDFTEIDVETSTEGRRAYRLVSGRGVPILLVGDEQIHGYSPERSRKALLAAGLVPDRVR